MPGANGLQRPAAADVVVDHGRGGRALAVVGRFLIGVDVAQVTDVGARTLDVENGLATQQVVGEGVFRCHRGAEVVEGVVVVVFLVVLGGEVDREVFRGVEEQAATHGVGIAIVHIVAGEEVLAVAVPLFLLECQASGHAIAEAAADGALEVHQRVVADGHAGVAIEFLGRTLGDQVHGACGGATAVERALRAAQYFHALEVVEACHLRGGAREDRAVLVHRHCAVGAEVDAGHADAADEDPCDAELVTYREVGDGAHQVTHVRDAARGEGVAAHNRHGSRGGCHR